MNQATRDKGTDSLPRRLAWETGLPTGFWIIFDKFSEKPHSLFSTEKKGPRIPQYKLVYETLRKHIAGGLYKAGDLLPSENDLCRTYHVTQPTVRQALALLVNEGYIKKRQGKGSIVQEFPKGLGLLSIEGRLSNSSNPELKWQTRILSGPKIGPWPKELMFPATTEEMESGAIHLERKRIIEGLVVFYERLWIPNINMSRFCSRQLENKSLYSILRTHYQVEVARGEQKIWAIAADARIADLLEIPEKSPVLRLERRMDTNRHNFSIYTSLYCNTDQYLLHGTF